MTSIRDNLPLVRAAALPGPGLTAWQELFEHASLKPSNRILIIGAGGAVGGYAVQLAHQTGATVTATASARCADRMRAYGADEIIDYTVAEVIDQAKNEPFDVVLNLVPTSPQETTELASLTASGGIFVSTTTPAAANPALKRTIRMTVRSDAVQLMHLYSRVSAGDLLINVTEIKPLEELSMVHDQYNRGTHYGKIVFAA
ncbi:zinc-binding dehydrogenase [Streptomyces sp. NPDC006527]|uniref:zinc-binding dehydrogenase n=1 Tax=Streptomyces sp. NPDC006527 TaxID=3364749 RepID=UPI003685C440